MTGKLTLRPASGAPGSGPAEPGTRPRGWDVSAERLERLRERARVLRRDPGPAEQALWARLSGAQLGGIKFSHKTVVGSAIVDFACPSRWVVVSLSGADANAEVDALQDRKLAEAGIRVLRFSEAEALTETDRVVSEITTTINTPFERGGSSAGRNEGGGAGRGSGRSTGRPTHSRAG